MPELPEVEFTKQKLNTWLVGAHIDSVWSEPGRPLIRTDPKALASALVGRRVISVHRRGKQLVWQTSGEAAVFVHLGMTGKWVLLHNVASPRKWIRIRLCLQNGRQLAYIDPRKLGRIEVVRGESWSKHPSWRKLGQDALALCEKADELMTSLCSTKKNIKSALLQQHRVAGVGNIYAAEALFIANIHPATPACDLDRADYGRLADGLKQTLLDSIAREVGDEIDYVTAGRAENPFLVYRREGELCVRCRSVSIVRIPQDGRSTFFCPSCQVMPIVP